MQALAQNGNGAAYYIDTLKEAKKVFGTDFEKSLVQIADDLKLQVEFNPDLISEYRLLGYETRALQRQDFNNDKVDAGDIGAGHSVTAIYEVLPVGAKTNFVDPLRYGDATQPISKSEFLEEYGFLKIRFKVPGEEKSRLLTAPITRDLEYKRLSDAPAATKWAVAVGAYALTLREDDFTDEMRIKDVKSLARKGLGNDPYGYRAEMIDLIDKLEALEAE